MKRFRLFIISLIICISSSVITSAQSQERIIKLIKWGNEPLEITKLKVSGKEVNFNQPFVVKGEDWFRDLTVTVKNISNQVIHSIDIGLLFYSNESENLPSRDHLLYGCYPPSIRTSTLKCPQQPIESNQTVTLILKDYESTRQFLNNTNKPQKINNFKIMLGEVFFADGRMWSGGKMHKQDTDNPRRWLPEKKVQQ